MMPKEKKATVYFDHEKQRFIGLTSAIKKQLKESYKGIDVDNELRKMSLWLTTPKGKHRTGNLGFIMNWLSRAAPDKSPSVFEVYDMLESNTPLGSLLQDYLKDLWKDRDHILEFNTIRH